MVSRSRLAQIERLSRNLPKVMTGSQSPLPKIAAAVDAAGGKMPGESVADASARLSGTRKSGLLADLRERASHA